MNSGMRDERRKVWNVGDTAGTPRARALTAALHRVLEESHKPLRHVGEELGKSHTTISQWSTGKRLPDPDDVSALLAVLHVTGKRREQIMYLAHRANAYESNWLAVQVSEQMDGLLVCESTAVEVTDWCPLVLPGLFQTFDYANAIIGSNDVLTSVEVRQQVELRLDRRKRITDREREDGIGAVQYRVLIGEYALRERIGGSAALIAQLRHLLEVMSEHNPFTVQVVPVDIGWHPGLMGPFTLYNFEELPSIVLLEHHRSSAFLYEDDDVKSYKVAAANVRRLALSPEDSAGLIESTISQMEKIT